MQGLTLQEVIKAVGGKCSAQSEIVLTDVCIDTRKVTPNCLFVAIKGERFDGHSFIDKAFELGAAAVISSQPVSSNKPVVYVEDTRLAFGALSSYFRLKFPLFVVGVTGSVGKTSTKEMIHTVMSQKYKTLKTLGNLNNDIGLPKTLLTLDETYGGAVLEMGMSARGEISYLAQLAKPNLAVITNVGVSHLENLGTRDEILKAKLEILDGMFEDATLILNADNDKLASVKEQFGARSLYFGIEQDGDVTASDVAQMGDETHFILHHAGKNYDAVIPTIGTHNVYNALAGFLVGIVIGLSPEVIIQSFLLYENSGMRQRISEHHGIKVIADCYNASPDSMQSAIQVISSISCIGKRIAVFGDMRELGEKSLELHRAVGEKVAQSAITQLFCYGEAAKQIAEGARGAGFASVQSFVKPEELVKAIREEINSGDSIIFKASRGIKLEEIMQKLFPEQ